MEYAGGLWAGDKFFAECEGLRSKWTCLWSFRRLLPIRLNYFLVLKSAIICVYHLVNEHHLVVPLRKPLDDPDTSA